MKSSLPIIGRCVSIHLFDALQFITIFFVVVFNKQFALLNVVFAE